MAVYSQRHHIFASDSASLVSKSASLSNEFHFKIAISSNQHNLPFLLKWKTENNNFSVIEIVRWDPSEFFINYTLPGNELAEVSSQANLGLFNCCENRIYSGVSYHMYFQTKSHACGFLHERVQLFLSYNIQVLGFFS